MDAVVICMSMAPCLRKNDVIANLLGDGRWILIQGFAYFLEGFSLSEHLRDGDTVINYKMFVICHCFVLSYPPRHSKGYYIRLGFILHSKFRYDYRQWDDCISQSKFLCRLEFTLKSECSGFGKSTGTVLIDLFWYNGPELLEDRMTAKPKASQTPIAVILMMGK